ncbi:hypothetical protein Q1695_002655 [Nippostrongylus brasiliensis]|nr:hypothetical protein Q1695_002655 [Nippostrongylus brasiliensis]
MSLRTVKRWFAKFSEGDYNIEDKPRSGRPSDLDLEALQADLENNSEQSTRQLSAKLSCSHSAVARGLRRAGYKNVKGGDVPHELTLDNKNRRIDFNWPAEKFGAKQAPLQHGLDDPNASHQLFLPSSAAIMEVFVWLSFFVGRFDPTFI